MSFVKHNIIFGLITLLALFIYTMAPSLIAGYDVWILIFSLVLTGIPHGAIDHLIFFKNPKMEGGSRFLLLRFFLPYLLLIGATLFLWVIFPEPMFWFFLLVAAYHFGQSQLYYVSVKSRLPIKTLLYLLWGIFILSALWHFHWESQKPIIASVFNWYLEEDGALFHFVKQAFWVSGIGTGFILIILFANGKLPLLNFLVETAVCLILVAFFRSTSLYLSFAVYFGLWHSARVILTEYRFLKDQKTGQVRYSFFSFVKSFIPFSILSFIGLGLLFLVSQWLNADISPFMLFLVFISALTMPHAYFMEGMYQVISYNKGFRLISGKKTPLVKVIFKKTVV